MDLEAYKRLKTWDIVIISDAFEDREVAGLTGHICSVVDAEQAGVFVYGPERVWCIEPWHLTPTGETLPVNERPDPNFSIHVTDSGEIAG